MSLGSDHDRSEALSDQKTSATLSGARTSGSGADVTRLQLLFENMLEGYAYCRMIFDDSGQPDDFVYVDVNPAFERLTALSDVVGKRVTEVIPDIKDSNPEVLATYGRVTRSGEPERFEVDLKQLGIVLNISVFRPEPNHFVAVFEDVTERRRAEQKLEDVVRFLEVRVQQRTDDLAEALRILHPSSEEGTRPED